MEFEIFKFESVTSTNDVAINLIQKKKKITGCVYAKKQTKGRGTHGKVWISEEGNLFGSIFFPLEKKYPPFNEFAIINPVIISSVIGNFCDKKKITFKFPNDIFLNKKKVCGILQEHISVNDRKFLIIGIGINLVSNPSFKNEYEATNILLETENKPSIDEMFSLIISSYEKFFINLNTYSYKDFKNKTELMALN